MKQRGSAFTWRSTSPSRDLVLHVRPASTAGELTEERLDAAPSTAAVAGSGDDRCGYGSDLHVVQRGSWPADDRLRGRLITAARSRAAGPGRGSGELERLEMTRPSRYCPSDHVGGLAASEFGSIDDDGGKAAAVAELDLRADRVRRRIHRRPRLRRAHPAHRQRSLPRLRASRHPALPRPRRTGAVCLGLRPWAHPMDFHAVFEAWHDDGWWVYDATRLAPRQSLVRIGTGRDAADTSFATVTAGVASLTDITVTATSAGDLPLDDHSGRFALS